MYTKAAPKGKRIAAYLIDGVILTAAYSFFFLIFRIAGIFIYILLMILYFGLLEGGNKSGTLGKQAMKIVVVDKAGMPLDYSRGFLRALCKFATGWTVAGPVIGLFAADGRALHDLMAGTFVADGEEWQSIADNRPVVSPQPRPQPGAGAGIAGIRGAFAGNVFPVPENGIIMGRDQTACDLAFPDDQRGAGISRVHCKIQYNCQSQMFVLHDLGSSYGTFLGNGIRVAQGRPAALMPGEEFYLADAGTSFRTVI